MTILTVKGEISYINLTGAPEYGGRIPDYMSIVANLCLGHDGHSEVTFGTDLLFSSVSHFVFI